MTLNVAAGAWLVQLSAAHTRVKVLAMRTGCGAVSETQLRAHETGRKSVSRMRREKKKKWSGREETFERVSDIRKTRSEEAVF